MKPHKAKIALEHGLVVQCRVLKIENSEWRRITDPTGPVFHFPHHFQFRLAPGQSIVAPGWNPSELSIFYLHKISPKLRCLSVEEKQAIEKNRPVGHDLFYYLPGVKLFDRAIDFSRLNVATYVTEKPAGFYLPSPPPSPSPSPRKGTFADIVLGKTLVMSNVINTDQKWLVIGKSKQAIYTYGGEVRGIDLVKFSNDNGETWFTINL